MAKPMQHYESARNESDKALIAEAVPGVLLGASLEPVSNRTAATRLIGSTELAQALLSEDVNPTNPETQAALGELLARAVANARRAGIIVRTIPVERPIQIHELEAPKAPQERPVCYPDEVDYRIPGNDYDQAVIDQRISYEV